MTRDTMVAWALLDHTALQPVQVGDAISADAGGMPIYRVVGFVDGRARLSDEHSDSLDMALDGFRWKATAA